MTFDTLHSLVKHGKITPEHVKSLKSMSQLSAITKLDSYPSWANTHSEASAARELKLAVLDNPLIDPNRSDGAKQIRNHIEYEYSHDSDDEIAHHIASTTKHPEILGSLLYHDHAWVAEAAAHNPNTKIHHLYAAIDMNEKFPKIIVNHPDATIDHLRTLTDTYHFSSHVNDIAKQRLENEHGVKIDD